MTRSILSILAAFFIFTISAQSNDDKVSTTQKFDEVLLYISKMYVDDVNKQELTDAAIIAMLEKLDPHSTFISKEDVDDANSKIDGSFVGIGIRFQILKDTLIVVSTIPGGPSEKLGIMAGDKIVKIEGKSVAGIGLKNVQVREQLLGELGTKVNVEILRKNAKKPYNFVITRDRIPIHSVDCAYMVTPEIGYIKLNSFSRSSHDEVQKSIKDLKEKGMIHLIFDLQSNGGGLLHISQKIADEFLSDDKLIVYSEGRAQPRYDLKAGIKGTWETGNLVILTDEHTASASEIVSGAIQDWDRGLIVGRRTFGKGLVQRPIDLTDGSQMRLTIARYFTPSGRFIQKSYEDKDAYKKDILHRFENGELNHADSIRFPDSLMQKTLVTQRTVYNGGGIMPDIFVPLDTTEITDYYRSIVGNGHVNSFTLTYVNENRETILEKFPNFDTFKKSFQCDEAFMNDFFVYVEKEDSTLVKNDQEFKISEDLIKSRMKALIAQDLWGSNEFYEIYNAKNEILLKAIEVLQNGEYEKMNLAPTKN
jgi:carboxyl-terminal processing protease